MLRVRRGEGAADFQLLAANTPLDDAAHDAVLAADLVWLEVEPDPSGSALIAELGVDTRRALSVIAGAARWARVVDACASLGLDHADLDLLRPWLASQTLEAALGRESTEDTLRELAGDRVRHEMTLPVAVRTLAGFDDEAQFGLLDWTLELVEGAIEWPPEEQEARLRHVAPGFHRRMIVGRNRDWVLRIEDLVDAGTTAVIAVGELHLVGPDGVPELLAGRGFCVERCG